MIVTRCAKSLGGTHMDRMASASLETLITLSSTPPIPERSPRRPCGYEKPLPPLPDDFFRLEAELVPKPLFSRFRTRRPSKAINTAVVEYPSPSAPSPIIYPSDASTVASNRSSFVSVASSRPSTAATSVLSEGPSRTSSFTRSTPAPGWFAPLQVSKPLLNRSATLPSKRTSTATARPAPLTPTSASRYSGFPFGRPEPGPPPPRTSPQTCFSPEPTWPHPTQDKKPHFFRSSTLPPRPSERAYMDLPSRPLSEICHAETPIRVCPLSLPPPRTSSLTCFSPEPLLTPRVQTTPTRPSLRRKETPRKDTLRSLSARDSDMYTRRSLDLPRPVSMSTKEPPRPVTAEKVRPGKPTKSPSNLGQYTYVMDDKGVFILRG